MKRLMYLFFILIFSNFFNLVYAKPPRLIIQIVIDQLRGDLLRQYQDKFSKDGFNRLINSGLDFENTHHPHANTTTCAGHTTISTGSYPAMHGIIANEWYHRDTQDIQNCVEDHDSPLTISSKLQSPADGRSPKNIITSTFSDELMLADKGRAFGVSFKDRGAISLAGHIGKAFWYDRAHGDFISSQYYFDKLPNWVTSFNTAHQIKSFTWALSLPISSYRYHSIPTFQQSITELNQPFPRTVTNQNSMFYKALLMSPYADALTIDFAIKLIEQEKIGQDLNKTDYLGISLSANDAIGHNFGPNSIESEDNLIKLDAAIAKLLNNLDKTIGLDNTIIVLSADHGVMDASLYLKHKHMHTPRAPSLSMIKKNIEKTLNQDFHLPANTLITVTPPYIYLNHQILNQQAVSRDTVLKAIAKNLESLPNIYRVIPIPALGYGQDWLAEKVNRMAHPKRAGDLYIILPPNNLLFENDDSHVTHGSPWNYDSYVPLIIFPSKSPTKISRAVSTTDIAPTLSYLLGIKAPNAAVGMPLKEFNH